MRALRRLTPSPDGSRFLMLEGVETEGSPSETRVVLNWIDDLRARMVNAAPVPPR